MCLCKVWTPLIISLLILHGRPYSNSTRKEALIPLTISPFLLADAIPNVFGCLRALRRASHHRRSLWLVRYRLS